MKDFSVLIIAKDEEDRIRKALESVKWASEIVVVVDDRTYDKTAEVARQFTDKVFIHPWEGFVGSKIFGLQKTTNDWVLWLDADEVVSPELSESIRETPSDSSCAAFYTLIRSQFMDQWMKCWSRPQDKHVRFFRKSKVNFAKSLVHERLVIAGEIGRLEGTIDHYPVLSLSQHLDKINLYSTLSARQMHRQGVKFRFWQLVYYPIFNFLKAFLWRQGFRDGWRGFILNVLYACNTFLDYLKLWELERMQVHT